MTATISRRTLLTAAGSAALIGATASSTSTSYAASPAQLLKGDWKPTTSDRALVGRWARDTWRSLVAMTDETTGLPADNIGESRDEPGPQQLHLPHQHRRLPVEHRRRP